MRRAKPLVALRCCLCQPGPMLIREVTSLEYDALGEVMFRAIREGDSPYSDAQREAWMPVARSGPDWAARLAAQYVVVAEVAGQIVGFMSVDPAGFVDLAFILPEARGQGLFGDLLRVITGFAEEKGFTQLSTNASLMAQPAFARHGFSIVRHERITRNGVGLERAAMVKKL